VDSTAKRHFTLRFQEWTSEYRVPKDKDSVAARSSSWRDFIRKNSFEMRFEKSQWNLDKVIDDESFFTCATSGEKVHPGTSRK
jgi:hypothetical protein